MAAGSTFAPETGPVRDRKSDSTARSSRLHVVSPRNAPPTGTLRAMPRNSGLRVQTILRLQQSHGNVAVGRALRAESEREPAPAPEQVQRKCACSGGAPCEACGGKDEEEIK